MLGLIWKNLRGPVAICAVLAPLSMVLEVFADIQQPRLLSEIIDIGVASGDLSFVLNSSIKMISFSLVGLLAGVACAVLTTYSSSQMAASIRQAQFEKIQALSFAEVDSFKTSSLITRLTNDVTQMQQLLEVLLRGIRAPLWSIGAVGMAFFLSPKLGIVLCLSVLILILGVFLVINRSTSLFGRVQAEIDNMGTAARENLLGVRVVKALTLEKKRFSLFEIINKALQNSSIKAQSTAFLLLPLITLIMNLSVVTVLWFGGRMSIAGSLPAGKIMAYVNYLLQLAYTWSMLALSMAVLSRAAASARRISQVMNTPPSVVDPTREKHPDGSALTFDNVSFGYADGECTLKEISFTIPPGSKVGLIGATGSGKSTIAALAARFYDVTSGAVRIGNVDVRDMRQDDLRRIVGLVLQDSLLFSGTVAQNLRYGDENAQDEELWAALDAAQAGFVTDLPEHLESRVEQRGTNFSGGQKQRLNIARTLVRKPKVLIMDDSASALDLATEARLREAVARWINPGSLFVITQRISSIMDCDFILVLDNGQVTGSGTHRELLLNNDIYKSIAVSQLGDEVLK